jgi:hypothetical protein
MQLSALSQSEDKHVVCIMPANGFLLPSIRFDVMETVTTFYK